MSDTITIWVQDPGDTIARGLLVFKEIADSSHLRHGQFVTSDKAVEIGISNAHFGIYKCKKAIAEQQQKGDQS